MARALDAVRTDPTAHKVMLVPLTTRLPYAARPRHALDGIDRGGWVGDAVVVRVRTRPGRSAIGGRSIVTGSRWGPVGGRWPIYRW